MNTPKTTTQFKAFKAYEIKLLTLRLECFNLGFDLTINNDGYFEIYAYNSSVLLATVERFDQVQAHILLNSTVNYNYKISDLID
jgi:hypothetical protein